MTEKTVETKWECSGCENDFKSKGYLSGHKRYCRDCAEVFIPDEFYELHEERRRKEENTINGQHIWIDENPKG